MSPCWYSVLQSHQIEGLHQRLVEGMEELGEVTIDIFGEYNGLGKSQYQVRNVRGL